ncbi:MAG: signal peptidase I, partial [Firmicutes bacterium]|nr:signal peptidase I [Bacillota bacterium]
MSRRSKTEKMNKKEWIIFAIIVVAAVIFVRNAPFGTIRTKGVSMEPTLYHDDLCFINKVAYAGSLAPERGDIVVVNSRRGSELLIKRVIGVPGDTVDIVFTGLEYELYINDELLEEPYLPDEPLYQAGDAQYPCVVPENYYFLMGDTRNMSTDSRFNAIGMINEADFDGKIVSILYPFS